MNAWKQVKLGCVIEIKHGYAFKGDYISDVPTDNILVTPGNFHIGGGFKADKLKYFHNEVSPEYILHGGDIVVTMTDLSKESDTLGYSAKIPSDGKIYLHNQRIGLVEFISEEVFPDYIYWLMRTREYQSYIVGCASGTSIMHTSPSRIKDFEFTLPSLPEQKAIAGVLSCLDNKIDLLHRQNKTLEAMAETLFRQWFIEEAEDDWKQYQIGSFVEHVKVNINPQDRPLDTFCHFSIPAYDNGQKPTLELGKEIKSNKYLVVDKSILVSKLNPITPRVWGVYKQIFENSVCSTEFQVLKPNNINHYGFFYSLLKSNEVVSELGMAASGTSGSHQRVKASDILNISFSIPDIVAISEFSETIEYHIKKIEMNKEAIGCLVQMRDILLPKLMSGEVRVEY